MITASYSILKKAKRAANKTVAAETLEKAAEERDEGDFTQERKKEASNAASALLGVNIIAVKKYKQEPEPIFEVVLSPGGRVELGNVKQLIGNANFVAHIAAHTGKLLPTFKGKKWRNIAQALLDMVEEIEVSKESNLDGMVGGWLQGYLEKLTWHEKDEKGLADNKRPFIYQDNCFVFLEKVFDYVKKRSPSMTDKTLARRLTQFGCSQKTVPFMVGETWTTRSAWKLPEGFTVDA
jgi:hypothetical protein